LHPEKLGNKLNCTNTTERVRDVWCTLQLMDTTFAQKKGFKMEKLKKPLLVKNVDGTVNAGGEP